MSAFLPRNHLFKDFLFKISKIDLQSISYQDPKCLYLSGIIVVNNQTITQIEDINSALLSHTLTYHDLMESSGYFTMIVAKGHQIFVFSDAFGMEQIYSYFEADTYYISNRLHALQRELVKSDRSIKPNPATILASLCSSKSFFMQHHSHDTLTLGIELLPLDSYICLDKSDGASIKRKPFADELAGNTGNKKEYKALLEEAVFDLHSTMTALAQSDQFSQKTLDLSGGKDSRLIFASALSSGNLDHFSLRTGKVEGSSDHAIACSIAELFDAKYLDHDIAARYPIDADFALTLWRSYFAGQYHRIGAGPWVSLGQNTSSIRVNGGCGEVFRTVWGPQFRRQYQDKKTPQQQHLSIYQFLQDLPISKEGFDIGFDSFTRSLSSLHSEDIFEQLEQHYLFFRNRAHFGMKSFQGFLDDVAYSPFNSMKLLKASRCLSPKERDDGKFIFDLMDKISPLLNFLPYEKRPWSKELLQSSHYYNQYHRIRFDKENTKAISAWELSLKSLAKSKIENRKKDANSPITPFTYEDFWAHATKKALEALECMFSNEELAKLLSDDYFQFAKTELTKPDGNKRELISKLLGIYDLCFDTTSHVLTHPAMSSEFYDLQRPYHVIDIKELQILISQANETMKKDKKNQLSARSLYRQFSQKLERWKL